jgi:hypothetical protein
MERTDTERLPSPHDPTQVERDRAERAMEFREPPGQSETEQVAAEQREHERRLAELHGELVRESEARLARIGAERTGQPETGAGWAILHRIEQKLDRVLALLEGRANTRPATPASPPESRSGLG